MFVPKSFYQILKNFLISDSMKNDFNLKFLVKTNLYKEILKNNLIKMWWLSTQYLIKLKKKHKFSSYYIVLTY